MSDYTQLIYERLGFLDERLDKIHSAIFTVQDPLVRWGVVIIAVGIVAHVIHHW